MILEVQIRSFGAHTRGAPAHACQSFHFQKIPGGLNINIFFENENFDAHARVPCVRARAKILDLDF